MYFATVPARLRRSTRLMHDCCRLGIWQHGRGKVQVQRRRRWSLWQRVGVAEREERRLTGYQLHTQPGTALACLVSMRLTCALASCQAHLIAILTTHCLLVPGQPTASRVRGRDGNPDPGAGCLGACVLPEVPKQAARVHCGLLECASHVLHVTAATHLSACRMNHSPAAAGVRRQLLAEPDCCLLRCRW
jgi:hypothetical protein